MVWAGSFRTRVFTPLSSTITFYSARTPKPAPKLIYRFNPALDHRPCQLPGERGPTAAFGRSSASRACMSPPRTARRRRRTGGGLPTICKEVRPVLDGVAPSTVIPGGKALTLVHNGRAKKRQSETHLAADRFLTSRFFNATRRAHNGVVRASLPDIARRFTPTGSARWPSRGRRSPADWLRPIGRWGPATANSLDSMPLDYSIPLGFGPRTEIRFLL